MTEFVSHFRTIFTTTRSNSNRPKNDFQLVSQIPVSSVVIMRFKDSNCINGDDTDLVRSMQTRIDEGHYYPTAFDSAPLLTDHHFGIYLKSTMTIFQMAKF